MLDIDIEFRKGIFYIRLKGSLNKFTISKLNDEVTQMIKDNEIRNVIFNIYELIDIDIKGINALLYNYELCKSYNGKLLLCGIENEEVKQKIKSSRLLKYIKNASDEVIASKYITI